VLLVLWMEGARGRELWNKCCSYMTIALPVYVFFGLVDRLYQFYRFGSFFNTYVSIFAHEMMRRDPTLPAKYPFETPFHVGFFGALFTPEKSIFLFDPLLILMIVLAAVAWRRFSGVAKAYVITSALLLMTYLCFYARYTVWSGDSAWGDRYVSTCAELAALLAVPLLLRHRGEIGKLIWSVGIALVAVSVMVQAASVAFWLSLELYQIDNFDHPCSSSACALRTSLPSRVGRWTPGVSIHRRWLLTPGLRSHHMLELLPFLLKRVGETPMWVVNILYVVWGAGWPHWRGFVAAAESAGRG